MTKSKTRKNSPPASLGQTSNPTALGPSTPPPSSPKHKRKESSNGHSDLNGPTSTTKEVKQQVLGTLNDVKKVIQLATQEFKHVAETKAFTPMEGLATPSATTTATTTTTESLASPSLLIPGLDTVEGGGGGVAGESGVEGGADGAGSDFFSSFPSAYLKFTNLLPNGQPANTLSPAVDSSDSSDDSEMDDDFDDGGNSSSSNSSHASDVDEEDDSEEEDPIDSEEESEDEEDRQQHSGSIATKRKKMKSLHHKLIERIQGEQRHQQANQPLSQQLQSLSSEPTQSPSDPGRGSEKEAVVLLADQSAKAKWANWSVRTLWTLIMIGGFFGCVAAGPVFVILLVVMVQGLVYKEVIYLANVPSREKKLPWFRSMNWYFLFSTNYFFYGESLIHYFQHVVFVDAFLLPFATHHRFISFTLYVIGFVFFVANLKKGHYRFQFSQFAWTHMTLLLVVCQSHFIINNIFEGLIWFFLPASLVVANDIWAYIFGFFWGKTPLIKLSPKKTVEGFVGGWVMTMFFGMLFATLFLRYPYMICPVKDLRATAFSGLTCDPNPVFIPVKHYLKPWMVSLVRHVGLRNNYVMIAPLQWHVIIMACFASLIAPFGGFFASGFKRAFKIKDFGQSIPGHGGITDRMDCQFLMGLFSYMYYQSFIKSSALSVGIVLQSAIHNLKGQEQMELFDHMRQYLIGQGLLDEDSCVVIPPKEAWIS